VISSTLTVVFKPRFGLPLLYGLQFVSVANLASKGEQGERKLHCLVIIGKNIGSYHSTEGQVCLNGKVTATGKLCSISFCCINYYKVA
jgi:hypothetical protein